MKHPFAELRPEYERLLAAMTATRPREVDQVARKLGSAPYLSRFDIVSRTTGVPTAMIAGLNERESGCDFHTGMGQGDRWDRVSVHVPKGCGPFPSWEAAAEFYIHYDHLDDNSTPWDLPYACWKGEVWNGFGPRNHGRHTGYLWSGTNIYTGGKYVADGVWDPNAQDKQLGIVPVMLRMMELAPGLAFGATPASQQTATISPPAQAPAGVGGGDHDALWVQRALNKLGQEPPLVEDNNYGRRTREAIRAFQAQHGLHADGLFGPKTDAALQQAIGGA